MAKQHFKIEGLKELDEALKELPKATARNVLKRVLIKAAEPIEGDAETRAPELFGGLKRSFTTGTKLSRRQATEHRREAGTTARMTEAGWRSDPSKTVYVFVGPGPHAKAVQQEFGNAHHPAQPFMRPAWDSNKTRALTSIRDDLEQEIEKARKRLARKAEREAAKMKI